MARPSRSCIVLKALTFLAMVYLCSGVRYNCSERSAILLLRKPAYDFSMRILDRVSQNNDGHFVFSPLSAWLQLTALGEGATGTTRREIYNITKHHRNRCFKLKFAKIVSGFERKLKHKYSRTSFMVIDELLAAKKPYIIEMWRYYGIKVFLEDFFYPDTAALKINSFINESTEGVISEAVYPQDFNGTTLIMSESLYFKSMWSKPFQTAFEYPFRSRKGAIIGKVNMMNAVGYYHIANIPLINAKVLEIPCVKRFSMLLFLPLNGAWISDLFFEMQKTRLMTIFNIFKYEGQKLVDVKLPRFSINSTVDNLPDLLYDMGVKRVFDTFDAGLSRISDFNIFPSVMAQTADIDVTEQGMSARAVSNLVKDEFADEDKQYFEADRPFAYMIVDTKTQFILFAGVYSTPSLY